MKNGFLSDVNNISFIMNTDGAILFKSSNVSIWPLFLIINELPFKERKREENMILAGLWIGSQKPPMTLFLKPLTDSLKDLYSGVEVNSADVGVINVKGMLLACTCDLPARAAVTNFNQFNGFYSCAKCLQEGESAYKSTRKKGQVTDFPFQPEDPIGPARRSDSVQKDAKLDKKDSVPKV